MKKVLFYKLDQEHCNSLCSSFYKKMSISNLQTYNPCYTKFFTYYNNDSYQKYVPRSKELVHTLGNTVTVDESDNYKKYVFQSKTILKHQKGDTYFDRNIFVKPIPILDPIEYCKNQYRKPNHYMPNIFSWMTQKKINDTNNAAYVENLASFLLSNMTERDECPSFPLYYGGFMGIMNGYKYDATEEWDNLVEENWFKQACKQNKISIELKENPKYEELFQSYETYDSYCSKTSQKTDVTDTLEEDTEYVNEIIDLEKELEGIQVIDAKTYTKDFEPPVLETEEVSDDFVEELEPLQLEDCERNEEDLDDLEKYKWIKWLRFHEFPVMLCCMETMEITLEQYLNANEISDTEWKGILFQICFALAIAYRKYKFIHNDFHCCNIMVVSTPKEFLYYRVKDTYFKIPTYGKLIKIIDFNRSIFKVGNTQFFSDVFKKDGDAEGQYDYPYSNRELHGRRPPNPSFDLARLATTLYEYVSSDSEMYDIFESWTTDNYGTCLLENEDSFELYLALSNNIKNAKPEEQLYHNIFKELICSHNETKKQKVYKLF